MKQESTTLPVFSTTPPKVSSSSSSLSSSLTSLEIPSLNFSSSHIFKHQTNAMNKDATMSGATLNKFESCAEVANHVDEEDDMLQIREEEIDRKMETSNNASDAMNQNTSFTKTNDLQFLPDTHVDTFAICSEAILSVISIVSAQETCSYRSNCNNKTISASIGMHVQDVMDSVVFGPFGIWTAFCKTYSIPTSLRNGHKNNTFRRSRRKQVDNDQNNNSNNNDDDDKDDNTTISISASAFTERFTRHALEKPYVSSVMVHFLLRLILFVSEMEYSHVCDSKKNVMGMNEITLAKVRELLEMSITAMQLISPHSTSTLEKNTGYAV